MNYTYFQPIPTTPEEAKSQFRKLARENHPDLHPEEKEYYTARMQAINAEYAALLIDFEKASQRDRQQKAHAEGKKTAADYNDLDQVGEILREKIEAALNLEGVTVELCGLWVWLTGETKVHKETIKALGFKWSFEKTAWYFPGVKSFNRQKRTLEEIREMHGSQVFTRHPHARREEESVKPLHA